GLLHASDLRAQGDLLGPAPDRRLLHRADVRPLLRPVGSADLPVSLSLRSFHVFFIAVSIALSLWVAVWGISGYRSGGGLSALATGLFFLLTGAVLLVYFVRVRRKLKELGPDD